MDQYFCPLLKTTLSQFASTKEKGRVSLDIDKASLCKRYLFLLRLGFCFLVQYTDRNEKIVHLVLISERNLTNKSIYTITQNMNLVIPGSNVPQVNFFIRSEKSSSPAPCNFKIKL